jgi:hypothetical protein
MRLLLLGGVASAALIGLLLGAPVATAQAPVPCYSIGDGRFNCDWWPPGDGRSAGALVVADRTTVGFLHQGTNWVVCQERGGDVHNSRGYLNHWFAWTTADNGQTGWASAIEARGGDNFGPFGGGVPNCNGAHPGLPKWSGEWGRPPEPPPAPPSPDPGGAPPATAPPGYLSATVGHSWAVYRRATRLVRLRVRGAPTGATIRVSCLVRRCRLRRTTATANERGNASLTRMFKRRWLRPKTVVQVRITAPNSIGKVVRLRIRHRRLPRPRTLCLPPQARRPQRC